MVHTEQQLIQIFKERFFYKDGVLFWKNGPKKGKKAGHKDKNGYSAVRITFSYKQSKLFLLHRVIFGICHGYIPNIIDHIDRNPENNKVENLRPSDKKLNSINTGLSVKNKSGVKGVVFYKGKWDAFVHIRLGGCRKKINLGRFKTLEDAKHARKSWERDNWSYV